MAEINPVIFREYDVRGVFGETLHVKDAWRIGAAYAQMLGRNFPNEASLRICVGYDGRTSSPELLKGLVAGLSSQAVAAEIIGLGPTPMLYFSVFDKDAHGGIMITGSHNPAGHNGFKFMLGKSTLHGPQIQELGKIASAIAVPPEPWMPVSGVVDGIANAYVRRLTQEYPVGKKLRIGWDPGNGAAAAVLRQLTQSLPGEHFLINDTVDGNFPNHHPDPSVEENLRQLQQLVRSKKLDVGFAFDGDGDRIGVVAGDGGILWGDQILLYLAEDFLSRHPAEPVIGDVKCSQILFEGIAKAGGNPVMWKTGHSLIKSKMAEMKAKLAGEMSGHIFIGDDYYGFDDGLCAAVRFMRRLQSAGQSVADWRAALPQVYNTPEYRVDCPEARKFDVVKEVRARLQGAHAKFIDIDGVRVLTDYGWWLLRASNTQAALAVRCESSSAQGLEILKKDIANQLAASDLNFKISFH